MGRGDGLNVSAKTGEGLVELKRAIVAALEARAASAAAESSSDTPDDRTLAVLYDARACLAPFLDGRPVLCDARARVEPPLCTGGPALDLVLAGNAVRGVAERLGELVGATYSADLLDNLFSRFCVGK